MNRKLLALTMLLVTASAYPVDGSSLHEAIELQQDRIDESPDDAGLFNDLGNLLLLVDLSREAEEAYRAASQLDPESTAPRFNLGLLLHQSGRPAKARREFEMLLKIDPDHAWAHYQLGVLSARQGKRATAIRSYARALRLEPRLTDPAYNPHILENPLAASATLTAYADLSSVDLVPRTYEAPRRIAGLLIPMLSPSPEPIATEVSEPGVPAEDGLDLATEDARTGSWSATEWRSPEARSEKSPPAKRRKAGGKRGER